MRKLMIMLMLILFVGGHGLSNWLQPLHGYSPNTTQFGASQSININAGSQLLLVAEPQKSACCKFDGILSSANAAHCTADCGLASPQLVSSLPDRILQADLKMGKVALPPNFSEHFRPPIA